MSSDGSTFEIRNPAEQNQVLWTFPLSTKEDVRKAINGAREAFPAWAHLPAPDRGVILDKASQIITSRMEEMIGILTSEEGKTLAEAKAEMTRTRDLFRYFSGEGWRMEETFCPAASMANISIQRESLSESSLLSPHGIFLSPYRPGKLHQH